MNDKNNTLAKDREDYAEFLAEHGLTEAYVRAIVDDRSDHADLPSEFNKAVVALSSLEGCGVFATAPIAAGEHIGPARIGVCRTVLGRMVNHARYPNCEFRPSPGGGLEMYSVRDVSQWEELTLDYRQAARANPAAGVRPMTEEGACL